MSELEILHKIGLERAVSTHSIDDILIESQTVVLKSAQEFGVDKVYFNTDENAISFPAVFLKKVNDFDIKTLKEIAETQKKIWNFKKVLFLYVYSEVEIRIYDCSEKPIIETRHDFDYESELKNLEIKRYSLSDKQHLEEINQLFSSIAIDTGIIWTLEEAYFIRKKINLQKRVDKYLIDSLVETSKKLENQGLKVEFIHKIILRSLFLLYLEDRDATDEQFYSQIKKGAKSYFDILDDVEATFKLYHKLEEHFNGNVFTLDKNENISKEQLQQIKKCFIIGNDNTDQTSLFENWRIFDFSIIQIELLSEIYENFLFKTDPELKKKTGTYYTPPALVEFILNEKLPINKSETEYNVKVLDPSCGSGIFLVESFKRLVKRYENHHKQKLTDFDILKKLLTDNIFGIELHPQAIKVAAFSLYLALVDNLNPKNIWQSKKHKLPNLINNLNDASLKIQGGNLFCRDTIETNPEIEKIEFDLVVGNPPFGTSGLSKSITNYCKHYDYAKEMVLPFLHKATQFAPNGQIALIFNTKVLTNTGGTYQNFRRWLFNDCYVDKVFNFSILRNAKKNFGGQLFGDATGPISIVYYQKEQPENPSDKIAYYAPKTYIKSNIIEGLNIDFTDLKYLPRIECQKPDTKIWKIAMWGFSRDFNLIFKLLNHSNSFSKFLKEKNYVYGVGLQPINESTQQPFIDNELTTFEFIRPEKIERFLTTSINFSNINSIIRDKKTIETYLKFYSVQSLVELPPFNVFRRLGARKVYSGPMLLTKEGFKSNKLCFSFIDDSVAFNSSVLGFKSENKDELRFLSTIFNSKLATYFLLLISNSWGIERERVKPNEIYEFPIVENQVFFTGLVKLHQRIEKIILSSDLVIDYSHIESEINEVVYELYDISLDEKQVIEDFVNYSIDLFHKQEKSIALFPSKVEHVSEYGNLLTAELNEFLEGQDLFANVTTFQINHFSPLMMIKISFSDIQKEITQSKEILQNELRKLDQSLWEKKATNIYFRKKLNYKSGNDIFIIRPNQRRFWSKSMALEDATELILEILNEN